jgi:hypothetical protein
MPEPEDNQGVPRKGTGPRCGKRHTNSGCKEMSKQVDQTDRDLPLKAATQIDAGTMSIKAAKSATATRALVQVAAP